MLMIDPGTQETNLELSSENPVLFDISDGAMFQSDEDNYTEESTLNEDGIEISIYHNKNAKDINKYILIGEIEKEPNEPVGIYIFYENDGIEGCCMSGITANDDSSKVYFKCEVLKKTDTQASIKVGIKNGHADQMSSEEKQFDREVKLVF